MNLLLVNVLQNLESTPHTVVVAISDEPRESFKNDMFASIRIMLVNLYNGSIGIPLCASVRDKCNHLAS